MTLTARLAEFGMKSVLWMGGRSLSFALTANSFKRLAENKLIDAYFLLQDKK